jgi:hypothetical protein
MAPYARWLHTSFKQTLLDSCDEFLESSDRGNDKTRTKLITRVSKDITDIATGNGAPIPDDVEKVITHNLALTAYSLMFPVCPHMVWELCIWQCQRSEAGKVKGGRTWPSYIG